jgi:hypothetical protein
LRELGAAIFLDRPLGAGKHPLETDQTRLCTYLAFSRSIARKRLHYLAEELHLIPDTKEYAAYQNCLANELQVKGLSLHVLPGNIRPGSVSLLDMFKVADDFLILRQTDQPNMYFLRDQYRLGVLPFGLDDFNGPLLVLRDYTAPAQPTVRLTVYDSHFHKRLELDFDSRMGYQSRGGIEYPVSPLRVLRVWGDTENGEELREHDLSSKPMILQPLSYC